MLSRKRRAAASKASLNGPKPAAGCAVAPSDGSMGSAISWEEVRPADRLVLVRDGSWKLSARLGAELDELHLVDLVSDPEERVNLADDPAARPVRDRLARLIVEHVASCKT